VPAGQVALRVRVAAHRVTNMFPSALGFLGRRGFGFREGPFEHPVLEPAPSGRGPRRNHRYRMCGNSESLVAGLQNISNWLREHLRQYSKPVVKSCNHVRSCNQRTARVTLKA
jgi:hypothetical protein